MKVNKFTELVWRYMVIGGLTMPATPLIADTPAFVLGDVLPNQPPSFNSTRGWQFERKGGDYDIFITQLGVFDSGGDGLVNAHQIGLWRAGNVTGTLLASATVPAGTAAPLEWGYRWVPITPVRIPYPVTFTSYVVGAWYSADDADDLVTPRPSGSWPGFEFAADLYVVTGGAKVRSGNELQYPAAWWGCGEGCIPEIFWEPNFQYSLVPEPSVWVLLLPALLYGLWRLRRKR